MGTTKIGVMIRKARHAAGLTLDDVAERIGVTAGALSHIESGRRLPSPSSAVAIAEVLGMPSERMLRALDEEHSSRRRSSVGSHEPGHAESIILPAVSSGVSSRTYQAHPIEELLGAAPRSESGVRLGFMRTAPESAMRDTARWSDDTSKRIEALEQLSESAARAIRTLRGLVEDEDPAISREARRLLRELDVRLPEE